MLPGSPLWRLVDSGLPWISVCKSEASVAVWAKVEVGAVSVRAVAATVAVALQGRPSFLPLQSMLLLCHFPADRQSAGMRVCGSSLQLLFELLAAA